MFVNDHTHLCIYVYVMSMETSIYTRRINTRLLLLKEWKREDRSTGKDWNFYISATCMKLNVKLYLCKLFRTMNERMVSKKVMIVLEVEYLVFFLFDFCTFLYFIGFLSSEHVIFT